MALLLLASGAVAAPDNGVVERLSAPETISRSKDAQDKMQDTMKDIVQLQEKARKGTDVIRLNCVTDKLQQVKGNISVSDGSMTKMNEALAKGDDDGRQHQYDKINILLQNVLVLGTEAKNCVGDDVSYIGGTVTDEIIDPGIPTKDFTAFDLPALDTTRPPVATSF